MLVTKDRGPKAIIANPVLCKGRAFEDTVDQAALNIRRFGHLNNVILKTDNEPALIDLRVGVAEKLSLGQAGEDGLQVVPEVPPGARTPEQRHDREWGEVGEGDVPDPDAGAGGPDPG